MKHKLSQVVIQKRKELDLTQEGLAELTGLSRSTIARVERGEIENKDSYTLNTIRVALGLSLEVIAISIDTQTKTRMENELFELVKHVFSKDYQAADSGLEMFKEKYGAYKGQPYYDQIILFAESLVFVHQDIRQTGLNKAVKGIKISHPDIFLTKQKSKVNNSLDYQYIGMRAFSLIEYGLIKAIGDALFTQRKYSQAIKVYEAVLISLKKPIVDQSITTKLYSVICRNTANALHKLNQNEQALTYIQQGVTYCKDSGNIRSLPSLYQLGSAICLALNDSETAAIYQQKQQVVSDLLSP